MVVQEQGSSRILIGLLLQPSQAAGGVTGNRGSWWLRLYGQGFFNYILLAKEQLTPACVEVKSLNSSYFERKLHLFTIALFARL